MAKKKRKSKKSPSLPTDPVKLEALARREYAAGRYRRAKDAYKLLHKRDPEKYLADLTNCYKAMAAEMLEDGRPTDAEPILEHLRELTGKPVDPVTLWNPSPPPAENSGVDTPTDTKTDRSRNRILGIDAAIILLSGENSTHSSENADSEQALVHDALKSICESRFDDATKLVRGISAKSPYASWRLFIKGLTAYYTGKDEIAISAFSRLPAETTIAEAAKPFLFLLNQINDKPMTAKRDEWTMRYAGRLSGYGAVSDALARADYFCSVGRYRDALKHARKAVPDYRKSGDAVIERLRRFFEMTHFHMDEDSADKYRDVLFPHWDRETDFSSNEHWELIHIAALCCEDEGVLLDAEGFWSDYLGSQPPPGISKKRRDAEIFLHLGKKFSEPVPSGFFFFRHKLKHRVEDAQKAIDYLKQSIDLHDKDIEKYKTLLKVYTTLRKSSDRNRLLDTMITRFPEDKNVLLEAGSACLDRKAFQKGLKYLEQAVALDSLDTHALTVLMAGYILAARDAAKVRRIARMRSLMDKAVEKGIKNSPNHILDLGLLLARRAMLEYTTFNDEEGAKQEAFARQASSSQPVLDYFMYLTSDMYTTRKKLPAHEYDQQAFSADPDMKVCLGFHSILDYAAEMGLSNSTKSYEVSRIHKYAEKAYARGCEATEALEYAEKCVSDEFGRLMRPTAKTIVLDLLKTDRKNPRYRLLNLEMSDYASSRSVSAIRKELDSIVGEAEKRGDRKTVAQARRMKQQLDRSFFPGGRTPFDIPETPRDALEDSEDPFAPRPRKKRRKSSSSRKAPAKKKQSREQSPQAASGKENSEPREDASQLDLFGSGS